MTRWLASAALAATVLAAAIAVPRPAQAGDAGEWVEIVTRPSAEVGARGFARLVALPDGRLFLWGPPAANASTDWCSVAFDPAANAWHPLVPRGKEAWLQQRPKMYATGMRWGHAIRLERPEGLLQPIPMCYFHQAAYVPTMKRVLLFVGGKHLAFDPETNTWEELTPRTSPPHVVWSAMEYDPANDEVVLFGGGAMCEENRPGTWLFSPKAMDWRKLDQPLGEQPPPRCNAPLACDPENRLIALFGGDAQDHYLADTWVYDCSRRRWRELKTNVRPCPRTAPALCFLDKHGVFLMGGTVPDKALAAASEETWTLDAATGTWTRVAGKFPAAFSCSLAYDAARDRAILYQTPGQWPKQSSVYAWVPGLAPAGEGRTAPPEPIAKYRGPAWYTEGVPPADEAAGEKLIAALEPNTWTKLAFPREGMMRTWGSATVDTDRHEVVYWGGGHCGYCGTDVSHLSLKTLRWTTSFPPEFPPAPYNGFYGDESSFLIACRTFRGRPWVQHGRTSYAYDPVARMVVFTQSISCVPRGDWTYLYDPARRDFVARFPQPFIGGWGVSGAAVTTRRGVFDYLTPGDHRSPEVGLFRLDATERKWTNLSGGKATVPCPEKCRMVYDSTRDHLVLVSQEGSGKEARPALYAWDLAGNATTWAKLDLAGEPPRAFYRESVYLARHDRILNLNTEGLFACDLAAGNRWANTRIPLPAGAQVNANTAMVYDPGLDVLVLFCGGNTGPVHTWLMRYVPGAAATTHPGEQGG
ncbi:MAG TPA: hypothetical protein VNE39_23845 [Planctomycetota bacterium]|nr:hypothetical protein [Planctomycetota bacterium]